MTRVFLISMCFFVFHLTWGTCALAAEFPPISDEDVKRALVVIRVTGTARDGTVVSEPKLGTGYIAYSENELTTIITAAHTLCYYTEIKECFRDDVDKGWRRDEETGELIRSIDILRLNDNGTLVQITGDSLRDRVSVAEENFKRGSNERVDIARIHLEGGKFETAPFQYGKAADYGEEQAVKIFGIVNEKLVVEDTNAEIKVARRHNQAARQVLRLDDVVPKQMSGGLVVDMSKAQIIGLLSENVGIVSIFEFSEHHAELLTTDTTLEVLGGHLPAKQITLDAEDRNRRKVHIFRYDANAFSELLPHFEDFLSGLTRKLRLQSFEDDEAKQTLGSVVIEKVFADGDWRPSQSVGGAPQLEEFWRDNGSLEILTGSLQKRGDIPNIVSDAYMGPMGESLNAATLSIDAPFAPEEYNDLVEAHYAVILYALAISKIAPRSDAAGLACEDASLALKLMGHSHEKLKNMVIRNPEFEEARAKIESSIKRVIDGCST